jgi:rRNA pseudouridine-1189 N-methylase Emg1 (Nep1/Mra1 family)
VKHITVRETKSKKETETLEINDKNQILKIHRSSTREKYNFIFKASYHGSAVNKKSDFKEKKRRNYLLDVGKRKKAILFLHCFDKGNLKQERRTGI